MQLSTLVVLFVSVVACMASSSRETNGDRFRRGLPPLSPIKIHKATRALDARAPTTSGISTCSQPQACCELFGRCKNIDFGSEEQVCKLEKQHGYLHPNQVDSANFCNFDPTAAGKCKSRRVPVCCEAYEAGKAGDGDLVGINCVKANPVIAY